MDEQKKALIAAISDDEDLSNAWTDLAKSADSKNVEFQKLDKAIQGVEADTMWIDDLYQTNKKQQNKKREEQDLFFKGYKRGKRWQN